MKKTSILVSLLFGVLHAFAQDQVKPAGDSPSALPLKITNERNQVSSHPGFNKTTVLASAVWSDDFNFPSNWVFSKEAGTTGDWTIGTKKPAKTVRKIRSTTAANGFALFDSDSICSKNQWAHLTTANPIDLSGHDKIKLTFQQNYARFYDSTYVQISTDGTAWTKIPVNQQYAINDFSTNVEKVQINISNPAGGRNKVWIRFTFYSPATLNAKAGCGYSWQIDDIAIVDIPENDISLNRVFIENGLFFHTKLPVSQVDTTWFINDISNIGKTYQTKVKVDLDIKQDAVSKFSTKSPTLDTLPSFTSILLATANDVFVPPAIPGKLYTTSFHATQAEADDDTTNNFITSSFEVTDTVFARDNGDLLEANYTSPGLYEGGDANEAFIGMEYAVNKDIEASSISVFIDKTSSIGMTVRANIFEVTPGTTSTSTPAFASILFSKAYNITSAANVDKWVTLPLIKIGNEIILKADKLYVAGVSISGITAKKMTVNIPSDITTKQRGIITWLYLPGQAAAKKWGTTKDIPFIRLNVARNAVGISENHEALFNVEQNNPNPFSNTTSISFELNKPSLVNIDIADVTGRTLMTLNEVKGAGRNTIEIDATGLSRGMYFYTLKANGRAITKRMLIID